MCNRLGKGHRDYSDRNANIRDKDGKIRRNWNGTRIITRVYGHNALNAYCDLRDAFEGNQYPEEGQRLTPAKAKRLKRIWNCQSNQRATGQKLGPFWSMRRRDHQFRNHYTVNKAS